MGKIVLEPALEPVFQGLSEQVEICNAEGKVLGCYTPMEYEDYRRKLAKVEIPLSKEEIERLRHEKGGITLEEFWKRMGRK